MNRKTFVVCFVILGLGFLFFFFFGVEEKKEEVKNNQHTYFISEVYEVNDGYGYKIIANHKILIQQDFIPAISTKVHFRTKLDAYVIAELVIQRIKMGQDPKIEKQDLIDFAIDTKGINQDKKLWIEKNL